MRDNEHNKLGHNLILILIGVLIGVVNGFFGGGGGMICVPLLLMLGLKNRQAQATAILIMVPISIASSVVYYTSGYIDWHIVLWVALGSICGGVIGAQLLKKLNNLTLQYIFALVVIIAGVKMLF